MEWPSIEAKEGISETKILYKFDYLPAGLFNRAQASKFQTAPEIKCNEFYYDRVCS